MAELFDSLPTEPILRTFMQYPIEFRSRLVAAIDVISSAPVDCVDIDLLIKFGDSGSTVLDIYEPLTSWWTNDDSRRSL